MRRFPTRHWLRRPWNPPGCRAEAHRERPYHQVDQGGFGSAALADSFPTLAALAPRGRRTRHYPRRHPVCPGRSRRRLRRRQHRYRRRHQNYWKRYCFHLPHRSPGCCLVCGTATTRRRGRWGPPPLPPKRLQHHHCLHGCCRPRPRRRRYRSARRRTTCVPPGTIPELSGCSWSCAPAG